MKTINEIMSRRPKGWRRDKNSERYPFLSWTDYTILFPFEYHGGKPSQMQFEIYYFWSLANGFMPYGGESKKAMEDIYLTSLPFIRAEAEERAKRFDEWLDKYVEP